jgi:hypothetical protein
MKDGRNQVGFLLNLVEGKVKFFKHGELGLTVPTFKPIARQVEFLQVGNSGQ